MTKKLIMLCLVLMVGQLGAMENSLQLGAGIEGEYNDNIFMNASNVKDYMSRIFVDLTLPLKRVNLYLDASTDIYNENSDFNSYTLESGFEYYLPLKNKNQLFLAGGYQINNYNEIYTDFNYSSPKFQAGVKMYTGPTAVLKAGYSFYSRLYSNYESFDFYNHNGFIEYGVFFKSQTTLTFKGGVNVRHYPHIADDVDFGDDYNYYQNKGNHGMGPGYGGGSGSGQGSGHGQGSGNGNGNNSGEEQETVLVETHQFNVSNSYALLRVKQAIGTRLSFTGEAEFRKHFKDLNIEDTQALIKNAYVLFPYNDDFLWEGTRLALNMQTVLIGNLSFKGSVDYYNKDYPGILILDDQGDVVTPETERTDDVLVLRASLTNRMGKFMVSANFLYRDNQSNDDYFQYQMVIFSIGVSVNF